MTRPANTDPAAAFRFKVEFDGGPRPARFTEVGGLEYETETFDYKEGGLHTHVHRFPGRFKQGNLTLKRGIAVDGESLWKWVADAFQGKTKPCNVTVSLLSYDGSVIRTWTFLRAYPIKWNAGTLASGQAAVAIETLTLAHQGLLFPIQKG